METLVPIGRGRKVSFVFSNQDTKRAFANTLNLRSNTVTREHVMLLKVFLQGAARSFRINPQQRRPIIANSGFKVKPGL